MLYVSFPVKDTEYKLRLSTSNVVSLEKALGGRSPLSIFGDGEEVPTVTTLVTVLHASLQQYQSNITMEKAYSIFDKYLEDGHVMTDFIPVILEIFKVSGLIKNTDEEEDNEENNEKNE